MKIAVASNGIEADSTIADTFADAKWLLIVDMDQNCICEAFEKGDDDLHNKKFADIVVQKDCESVICGDIEKIPFEILADNCVTRSRGQGLSVTEALNCESILPLITDYIGGPGCSSTHS